MQMIGSRTRAVAAAMALTMGLSACAGLLEETCGPQPSIGTPENLEWLECSGRFGRQGVVLGLLLLAAFGGVAAIAMISDDGGGSDAPAGD